MQHTLDFEHLFWNGEIVPKNRPLYNGQERGILFGEGLFETVLVQNKPLFLKEHLQRMAQSTIQLGYPQPNWDTLYHQLLTSVSAKSARLRITLTVGPYEGTLFSPPKGPINIMASLSPYSMVLPEKVELKTWPCSRSEIHRHKSTSLAENSWLARQKGSHYELLLLDSQHGWILEGITHNFFTLTPDLELWTPSLDLPILPGITRSLLLKRSLYPPRESRMVLDENVPFICPFLCNSIAGLVPIHSINGKATDWSKQSLFEAIHEEYLDILEEEQMRISSL